MSSSKNDMDVKLYLKEKLYTEILPGFERMIEALPDELNDFAQAEHAIRAGCLKLAGQTLQHWACIANRRIEIPRCPKCGKKMRHRGLKPCKLVTTIGPVDYRRPRYRCNECQVESHPHDATVRFLSHGVSQSLAMVIARMGGDRSFAHVVEDLVEDYHVRIGKQLAEEVTEHAGEHIIEIEDATRNAIRELPPRDQVDALPKPDHPPSEIAVACCDGTMLHTREIPSYLREKSKNVSDWREVRVANISTGKRLPSRKTSRKGRGYGFRMEVATSRSFARFESVEDVGLDMYLAACQSGFFEAPLRCFISDGARWLRTIAEEHFPDAIMILDWFHAMEHIGELASQLFGEGTRQAKAWTARRETELWEGRIGAVLRAIDRQREKDAWTAEQIAKLESVRTYLANNRDRTDYPRYRSLGLPIGSGRVEGLCKTLVEGRCKQSGMRGWRPRGVEGVLRLRAARHDRTFKQTWYKYFTRN